MAQDSVSRMTPTPLQRGQVMAAFREGRTQTLTRKLHQAETADFGRLYASAVIADGIFETLLHGTLVLRFSHVDEVDHDQTAQIAQTHLAPLRRQLHNWS